MDHWIIPENSLRKTQQYWRWSWQSWRCHDGDFPFPAELSSMPRRRNYFPPSWDDIKGYMNRIILIKIIYIMWVKPCHVYICLPSPSQKTFFMMFMWGLWQYKLTIPSHVSGLWHCFTHRQLTIGDILDMESTHRGSSSSWVSSLASWARHLSASANCLPPKNRRVGRASVGIGEPVEWSVNQFKYG